MGFCLTLEFVLKRGKNKNICVLTIGLRLKLQKLKKRGGTIKMFVYLKFGFALT